MKTLDRICTITFALVATFLVLCFIASAIESRPMYAHDNSPPYGPPGGMTEGGAWFLAAIFPTWLRLVLFFAGASVLAGGVIVGDGIIRLVRGIKH